MKLGGIDLKRSIKSFALANGAEYASQAILQGVPRRALTGWEASDVTLRGAFHQQLIDIWSTHEAVFQLTESGEIVDLEFDNGDVWSSFVVLRITMTPTTLLPDETWIACDVEIMLGDPGTQADEDMPKPIAVTGVSGAKSGAPLEDRSVAPGAVTAAQVARRG